MSARTTRSKGWTSAVIDGTTAATTAKSVGTTAATTVRTGAASVPPSRRLKTATKPYHVPNHAGPTLSRPAFSCPK